MKSLFTILLTVFAFAAFSQSTAQKAQIEKAVVEYTQKSYPKEAAAKNLVIASDRKGRKSKYKVIVGKVQGNQASAMIYHNGSLVYDEVSLENVGGAWRVIKATRTSE